MRVKRSLVAEDLNLSLNGFIWHDYPELLRRLGFNDKTAGMLVADLQENTSWWRRH